MMHDLDLEEVSCVEDLGLGCSCCWDLCCWWSLEGLRFRVSFLELCFPPATGLEGEVGPSISFMVVRCAFVGIWCTRP
jgi:hypothetical protein